MRWKLSTYMLYCFVHFVLVFEQTLSEKCYMNKVAQYSRHNDVLVYM